jgi:hypothetical protein
MIIAVTPDHRGEQISTEAEHAEARETLPPKGDCAICVRAVVKVFGEGARCGGRAPLLIWPSQCRCECHCSRGLQRSNELANTIRLNKRPTPQFDRLQSTFADQAIDGGVPNTERSFRSFDRDRNWFHVSRSECR